MAEWQPLGDRAIRFRRPTATSPRAIVDAVRRWPGVIDVVIARNDVGVYFDAEPGIDVGVLDALDGVADAVEPARTVDLHAIYDGPDLEDVARTSGLVVDDVIRTHAAATYVVETMGFAPGFAYLTGLDPRLRAISRRPTPRARVPAGSLAIAGGYSAVYPFDSPGGWNLIGRVNERMFTSEGAVLRLGDRVRFVR